MNEGGWIDAVLGSFAVKLGAPVLTFLGGIWISRANIMNAVTNRVNALIGHLEKEIERLTTAHKSCEDRCETLTRRVSDVEGELRQAKQTIDSIGRVK